MSFAARALTHRSYRRRHLVGLTLVATLLLWLGVWAIAAYRLNQAVDVWVKAAKAKGLTLSFADRSTDGTPFAVHAHLNGFTAKTAQGDHELRAGEAVFYLDLWDWQTVSTKLRRTIDGRLAGLPFNADSMKVGFSVPEHPPLDHMETGFSLWVNALGLTFPNADKFALGPRIDHLAFDVRVMGTPPDFTDTASVRAWNDNSGVFEFDHLDLIWGPLALSAKGTVGLTADLQPEGAFSGKVDGLDATLDRLAEGDLIEPRQQAMLRSSISVLARPSGVMGGSAPIVPISLQSGALYLGPVKLIALPRLAWAAEMAPPQKAQD